MPETKTSSADQDVVSVLLSQVEHHFRHAPATMTYQFTLGKIADQWRFRVVQRWQSWMDESLQYEFSGETPAQAILAFLQYVEDYRIDVSELAFD